MSGPKRWPPLIIPQMPRAWIRAGIAISIALSLFGARAAFTASCGFGDEFCHPWLGSLGAMTITIFRFWLIAICLFIVLGIAHIARVTIAWLRLDVLRPRRT